MELYAGFFMQSMNFKQNAFNFFIYVCIMKKIIIVLCFLASAHAQAQNLSADKLNRLGITHFDSGNYVAAINCFTKAITLDSNNYEYYSNRAMASFNIKQYKDALADIDLSLKMKPNFPNAYYLRGNIKDKMGDHDGAIRDFTKEVVFNPDCFKCYYNLGNVYTEKKDYTLAIEMFAKCIAIEPGFSEAYNNSGIAKYKMKDRAGACADWKKAFELGNKEAGKDLSRLCN